MTTTPVINTGGLMPAQEVKATSVPDHTKSFSDVFKQSATGNAGQMTKTDNLPGTTRTDNTTSGGKAEKSGSNIQSRQAAKAKNQTAKAKDSKAVGDSQQTTDDTLSPQETEQAMEVLAETAVTVVDKLAEFFQITPEEVSDTMEMLGMSDVDLFDAASFRNLFAALAQDPEGSFLLMGDELADGFSDLWKQVSQMFEEAGEANGWSAEQLQGMLDSQDVPEETAVPTVNEEIVSEAPPKDTSYTVTFMQDGKEVTYDVTKDGESGVAATEGMAETEVPRNVQPQRQETNGQHKENTQQTEKGAELVQEFHLNQVNTNGEQLFAQSISSYSQVDTQSIMEQIMDYMKIDNSEAFTKLEMQLHPETMGRVVIQLTSHNGELTAQITTQNEAVRAALESQLVSLKENLNDQGLKVENVQVTVESHAFEQSYEGERQSENREAFANRPRTHRIRLDDINLDDEELTDEERMVAELMADRGGTLDYTV